MKAVLWIGNSQANLIAFPDRVRRNLGYALHFAQMGDKHPAAKPLKGFSGAGVLEIVESHEGDTYRAIYTVKFANAVYVLHAFQKKAKKGIATPKRDMDLVKSRLKQALDHFRQGYKDLALPEADDLQAKAEITRQIFDIIKDRKLTQTAAAKILGVAQPDVSNLMNGRLTGFSIDRLFHMINALDCDVEIVIRRKPVDSKAAGVVVVAA